MKLVTELSGGNLQRESQVKVPSAEIQYFGGISQRPVSWSEVSTGENNKTSRDQKCDQGTN